MRDIMLRLFVQSQALAQALQDEQAQDLVEYALVIAVICLGVISGMGTLANGIDTAMGSLSTNINSAVV